MGSEKYSLMIETLKFLEVCQLYLKSGKISLKAYCNMSRVKLQFIGRLMEEEHTLFKEDRQLRLLLNKVIVNHYILINSFEKVVVM